MWLATHNHRGATNYFPGADNNFTSTTPETVTGGLFLWKIESPITTDEE